MSMTTLSLFAALQRFGPRGYQGMMGGWGWGFGILAMLFWLALIVLVIVLVWRLLERGGREDSGRHGSIETPLDIIEKRYARGEIDRDEFDRMKRDLT